MFLVSLRVCPCRALVKQQGMGITALPPVPELRLGKTRPILRQTPARLGHLPGLSSILPGMPRSQHLPGWVTGSFLRRWEKLCLCQPGLHPHLAKAPTYAHHPLRARSARLPPPARGWVARGSLPRASSRDAQPSSALPAVFARRQEPSPVPPSSRHLPPPVRSGQTAAGRTLRAQRRAAAGQGRWQ